MKLYKRICSGCTKELTYKDKCRYVRANELESLCRSCACTLRNKTHKYTVGQNNPQWKSPNEIPYSWFSKYFERKNRRKRIGSITIDDVYNLWAKQDKKCSLSGVTIGWNDDGRGHTCSIDRIDSSQEYNLNNIQLVHKDINRMKNYFDQSYFIQMCKLISVQCELK